MEEAAFFVTPFLLSYTSGRDPEVARGLVSDATMIDRAFAARDTFLIIRIAELGVTTGRLDIVERAIELLEPHQDECATLGLMGSIWAGPVAYYLGTLCRAAGRPDDAVRYLDKSLRIAENMHAHPYVARANLALADIAADRGETGQAEQFTKTAETICDRLQLRPTPGIDEATPQRATPASGGFSMLQQGDVWHLSFQESDTLVKDSKGMRMLATLVGRPGQDVHVLDLSGSSTALVADDAGPALDGAARAQYQSRVGEIQEALQEAIDLGDTGRADSLQSELDFITAELSRAFGLGGRSRRSGSAAERARVNVRRRLKDAIGRIAEQDSSMGTYLENCIKTGSYCKYVPV